MDVEEEGLEKGLCSLPKIFLEFLCVKMVCFGAKQK